MRIGLIIYGDLNEVTGGYIYDKYLVDFLRAQRVTVKVFSQKKKSLWETLKHPFANPILNEIIEFSPDILLQDEMNFISLWLLNRKIQPKKDFPIISIVHLLQANILKNNLFKWISTQIERVYFKSVNGYIFNSLSTKRSVFELVGTHPHCLVAYPGKDRLQLQMIKNSISTRCHHHTFKIIFIGNLSYNKGLHILIHALSQVVDQSWSLSIVGKLDVDVQYTQKIFTMISDLKLEHNITIYGVLNIEQLKSLLLLQHILIVPSYFESYGIVYAEAMSAALPVIACNTGGVPEMISDSINGFLIPPGDTVMLKHYILKLIKDRKLLEKMSFSSLCTYQHLPSWEETMSNVYHFLQSLIKPD